MQKCILNTKYYIFQIRLVNTSDHLCRLSTTHIINQDPIASVQWHTSQQAIAWLSSWGKSPSCYQSYDYAVIQSKLIIEKFPLTR